MGKTALGCLAILVVAVVVAGIYVAGQFNGLVTAEESTREHWAQVEARSRVGQLRVEAGEILRDPANFARFQEAQDALSSALQRLLVVVERYPELKSVAAFQDLMVQLEGTENRISVARTRYNQAPRALNTRLKRIPTHWFVDLLGWEFDEASYFEAQPGSETAPAVRF
ncbi:MAG: LemA family protein [Thermoanaerobaculia bacterium]